MELVLKTDSEEKAAMIIAFAKKIDVLVENRGSAVKEQERREELNQSILNFQPESSSSFGDAAKWELEQRKDRDLPFPK